MAREIWPGRPYPLGAIPDATGTNFSVYSSVASRVELCLFDAAGQEERLDLPEITAFCWHGYVPGVQPGQRYGFRVHGPWAPKSGQRCNPAKLLVDPYARAIDGDFPEHESVYAYRPDAPQSVNDQDSAAVMPKCVVHDDGFDWGDDRGPGIPIGQAIIYETHVKGFTARHPAVPAAERGTYLGLAHPAVLEYLTALGITAVELLPVAHFAHEPRLLRAGQRNLWGYQSIGYMAPYSGYAAPGPPGDQVRQFKTMVKALHTAGIAVVLDVVFNHTGEGGADGPTLCFRGLDNAAYYRLDPANPAQYVDYTGCGNSLNAHHPQSLQLVMDALRYWVTVMHVDAFRFDLASTLAREEQAVDRFSSFLDLVHQDPVIQQVKLIAEPWDIGAGGYQVGNFPPGWAEWNGKFRDCVRDYWRGAEGMISELATRLAGSSDLYGDDGRKPFASISFVTAHDGFTLRDLVSYNDKHNEANGEGNRDGESHNRSWNCGVEGETDDAVIKELRARQQRNFLTTLLLAQGTPMLLAGDECGRTQRGNNNAYCQDNELSWMDWSAVDADLLAFTRRLIALRREHWGFRHRRWLTGKPVGAGSLPDVVWLTPAGTPMADADWGNPGARALGMFLNGDAIRSRDARGRPIRDDSFLLVSNAWWEPLEFRLPAAAYGKTWVKELDTHEPQGGEAGPPLAAGAALELAPRSMVVLRRS